MTRDSCLIVYKARLRTHTATPHIERGLLICARHRNYAKSSDTPRERVRRRRTLDSSPMQLGGILLIPIGCISSASGLLLMKASVMERPDLPAYKNVRWLLGFFLLGIMATVVDVIVLGMLPLSVVAPFAGLTIVFSLLLASSGLITGQKEQLSRSDLTAIFLVLCGVTLVSAFGPHSSEAPSLSVLIAAFQRPRFGGLILVAATSSAARICRRTPVSSASSAPSGAGVTEKEHGSEGGGAIADGGGASSTGGGGGSAAWAALVSAFAAATCGCLSQLMLKLLSTSLGSLSTSPDAYAPLGCALVGLAFSAPMHLKLLNETLAGASVAIAVPCYQFLLLGCTTAAGGLLFDEFAGSTPQSLLCYAIGVATATAGLVVLTRSDAAAHDELLDEIDVEEADLHELEVVCEGESTSGGSDSDLGPISAENTPSKGHHLDAEASAKVGTARRITFAPYDGPGVASGGAADGSGEAPAAAAAWMRRRESVAGAEGGGGAPRMAMRRRQSVGGMPRPPRPSLAHTRRSVVMGSIGTGLYSLAAVLAAKEHEEVSNVAANVERRRSFGEHNRSKTWSSGLGGGGGSPTTSLLGLMPAVEEGASPRPSLSGRPSPGGTPPPRLNRRASL